MDIILQHTLQEAVECVILPIMANKKEKQRTPRYRLLLQIPEEEKPLWHKARVAALADRQTVGQFVLSAIREKLERKGHYAA